MVKAPTQLTLGVSLNDDATFDNFLVGTANQQLVESLRNPSSDSQIIYLWGTHSAGISHLLQAMCHYYATVSYTHLTLPTILLV